MLGSHSRLFICIDPHPLPPSPNTSFMGHAGRCIVMRSGAQNPAAQWWALLTDGSAHAWINNQWLLLHVQGQLDLIFITDIRTVEMLGMRLEMNIDNAWILETEIFVSVQKAAVNNSGRTFSTSTG